MAIQLGDLHRLRALFSDAQTRVRAAFLAALDQAGRKIEGDAKRRAPWSSGLLRSSIGYEVREPGILSVGVLRAEEGETLQYARIQDLGGRVNARPGGWLAIPLDAVKTKAGVAGIRARDLKDDPGQLGFRSTFFQVSRRGNLILFGKLGTTASGRQRTKTFRRGAGDGVGPASRDRSSIVPLFVLKGSVTLRGNRYLTGAVEDNLGVTGDFISRRVLQAFAEAA